MRKLITSIAIAATILSGCTKGEEPIVVPDVENVNLELTAVLPETRTYLGEHDKDSQNIQVLWSANDALTVWADETSTIHKYDLVSAPGATTADFKYTPTKLVPNGVIGTEFYAIYPYNTGTVVSGDTATIELPDAQVCNSNTTTANFEPNYNPMAAVGTELNNMKFKNLCGILVIDITPDQDLVIDKIELATKKEVLCGKANVTFKAGEDPTIKFTELTKTKLTLVCNGVELKANTKYPFYLVVPEGTYTYLDINIYTSEDNSLTESTLHKVRRKSNVTINKSVITRIGANFTLNTLPEPEPIPPHAYKVGDVYPFEGTPIGIVFALTNPTTNDEGDLESTKGKMVYLNKITEQKPFYKTNVISQFNLAGFGTNANNGMANLTQAKNSLSTGEIFADVFPAYGAVQALGTNWYLPARNELKALMDELSTVNATYQRVKGESTGLIAFASSLATDESNTYCSSTAKLDEGGIISIYGYNKKPSSFVSQWLEILCLLTAVEADPSEIENAGYKDYSNLKFRILPVSTFDSTK